MLADLFPRQLGQALGEKDGFIPQKRDIRSRDFDLKYSQLSYPVSPHNIVRESIAGSSTQIFLG